MKKDKTLIIMAGLPGSGKSYVRKKYFSGFTFVDCDDLKKTIKGYDTKNPREFHAQSKVLEKQAIYNLMAEGKSFVYDTTASNTDRIVKMVKEAQSLGYNVFITYVKTSLATAIERNSKRDRVVPEEIIIEKYNLMGTSMEILKKYADDFLTIDNERSI